MTNTNCYIFAFATFGHPNDFRQTPFQHSNPDIARQIKVFDLSNAIKVFPNSKIYSIRKERIGNSKLIAYSIYTYAQEQTSKRDGTFIGSSIILENKLTEEANLISCLNEFHQKLTENNLSNDVLKVNHSKDFIPVANLKEFEKIKNPQIEIKDLDFIQSNKSLVVFCDTSPSRLEIYYKNAVDLLSIYDTIYFTDSREVAEFVNQKGIFKLIQNVGDKKDFDKEIDNLFTERKRKIDLSLSEFEREIQRLEEDKNKTLKEIEKHIEQNEQIHQENESKINRAKKEIAIVNQLYDDFASKIKELANQLKSGMKLEDVRQINNENKLRFIEGINRLEKPSYINKINKHKVKSNLHVDRSQETEQRSRRESPIPSSKTETRIDIFKVLTIILAIALIITWGTSFFSNDQEVSTAVQAKEGEVVMHTEPNPAEPQPIQTEDTLLNLNPKPNSELNENDYRLVASKLSYGLKIGDVVKVIFDKNPSEIKKHYAGQEDIYSKLLFKNNENCFVNKGGILFFSKDTLRHIPSNKR